MICYVIIIGSLILNLFVLTYDDILYPNVFSVSTFSLWMALVGRNM